MTKKVPSHLLDTYAPRLWKSDEFRAGVPTGLIEGAKPNTVPIGEGPLLLRGIPWPSTMPGLKFGPLAASLPVATRAQTRDGSTQTEAWDNLGKRLRLRATGVTDFPGDHFLTPSLLTPSALNSAETAFAQRVHSELPLGRAAQRLLSALTLRGQASDEQRSIRDYFVAQFLNPRHTDPILRTLDNPLAEVGFGDTSDITAIKRAVAARMLLRPEEMQYCNGLESDLARSDAITRFIYYKMVVWQNTKLESDPVTVLDKFANLPLGLRLAIGDWNANSPRGFSHEATELYSITRENLMHPRSDTYISLVGADAELRVRSCENIWQVFAQLPGQKPAPSISKLLWDGAEHIRSVAIANKTLQASEELQSWAMRPNGSVEIRSILFNCCATIEIFAGQLYSNLVWINAPELRDGVEARDFAERARRASINSGVLWQELKRLKADTTGEDTRTVMKNVFPAKPR